MASDILYILGHQDEYEELRYSLRSLRFLPHRDVFIVGAPPPEWCVNVIHIPTEQRPVTGSGTEKYVNIKYNQRLNLLAGCDKVESFVLMDDDFIFVVPLDETLPPVPNLGTITETHGVMDPIAGPYQQFHHWYQNANPWARSFLEPLHFAEHVPMLMRGEEMGEWMRAVWHIPGFPIPTLYGNMMGVDSYFGDDFVLKKQRHHDNWSRGQWAVSTVEYAFYAWPVGQKLRDLHSDPSPYERT